MCDRANFEHEYAVGTCHRCGSEYCWTCANGPHNDSGDWDGMACPECGTAVDRP